MIAVSWYNPSGQISYWLGSNTTSFMVKSSPTCQNSWSFLFFYLFNHLSAFTSYYQPIAECKFSWEKSKLLRITPNWQPSLSQLAQVFKHGRRFSFNPSVWIPFDSSSGTFQTPERPTTTFISSTDGKPLIRLHNPHFKLQKKQTHLLYCLLRTLNTTHEGIQLSGKAVILFGKSSTTPFCLCSQGTNPRQSAPFARNP